jgi:hypothetical protein
MFVTATATNMATNDTSEFSNCIPVTACAVSDDDCDGFKDTPVTLHQGPANTNTSLDNCIGLWNPDQANADGNFTDQTPPKVFDDLTWPSSDIMGDVCDDDADNDGIKNSDEWTGALCGGVSTSYLDRDTDGDRIIDGAECTLVGTNPSVITSPAPAACGAAGDADGDFVLDGRERCYYGTNTASANSDGDPCGDRREIASINGDTQVNVLDLQQVAAEAGAYALPASNVKRNYDVSKNGVIDVIDLSIVAGASGVCP